jgi:hypothetical protein
MNSKNAGDFFKNLTTKTYTHSRLRRIVMYSAFGSYSVDEFPLYTVLLGANSRGRELIKSLRKDSAIPVLTKLADYRNYDLKTVRQFEKSAEIDKIYMTFLCGKSPSDYVRRFPYII